MVPASAAITLQYVPAEGEPTLLTPSSARRLPAASAAG